MSSNHAVFSNLQKGSAGALLALMTTLASMGLLTQVLPEQFSKMAQIIKSDSAKTVNEEQEELLTTNEVFVSLLEKQKIDENGTFITSPRFSTNGANVFYTVGDADSFYETVLGEANPLYFEFLGKQYLRDQDTVFVSDNIESCHPAEVKMLINKVDALAFELVQTKQQSLVHDNGPTLLFLTNGIDVFYKGEPFIGTHDDLIVTIRKNHLTSETAEVVIFNDTEYPLGIWEC